MVLPLISEKAEVSRLVERATGAWILIAPALAFPIWRMDAPMFANSLGIKPKPVLGFGNAVLAAIVIGKPDVSDCKITLPAAERIGVDNTPGSMLTPS